MVHEDCFGRNKLLLFSRVNAVSLGIHLSRECQTPLTYPLPSLCVLVSCVRHKQEFLQQHRFRQIERGKALTERVGFVCHCKV